MSRFRFRSFSALVLISLFTGSFPASAGFLELSIGGSYGRSEYGLGSYSWYRRYGGSIGYNFSDASTLEFAYQVSHERNHFGNYQDSTNDDSVYSINWVQNLTGKQATLQPYFKLGLGQLFRLAEVMSLVTEEKQLSEVRSVTGVTALGLRIFLTRSFAIRFEGTSYLVGGKPSTWRDNFAISAGGSIFY